MDFSNLRLCVTSNRGIVLSTNIQVATVPAEITTSVCVH